VLSAEERLEQIMTIIEELVYIGREHPIVVEGQKDVNALAKLGVSGKVVTLSRGISVFRFCEEMSREHDKVIIMTDWDRKGGKLARMLRDGFGANGVSADDSLRAKLVVLVKKEIKDIEGLPSFVERLRKMANQVG